MPIGRNQPKMLNFVPFVPGTQIQIGTSLATTGAIWPTSGVSMTGGGNSASVASMATVNDPVLEVNDQ